VVVVVSSRNGRDTRESTYFIDFISAQNVCERRQRGMELSARDSVANARAGRHSQRLDDTG
jgi:hypothetical protein